MYRPRDFASYILGIFICNLLLYLAFYIIMKVREAAVAVPGMSVSKEERIGLFFGYSLGSCGAAEGWGIVGLRVGQGVVAG